MRVGYREFDWFYKSSKFLGFRCAWDIAPLARINFLSRRIPDMKLNDLFSHWDQIHKDTLEVIDKFTEDELTHIAYDGGMTVGRIALHIADAEEGWFRMIATKERDSWPTDFTLENYPTKELIKTLLAETHDKTMTYLGTLTKDDLAVLVDSQWGEFSLRFIIWHLIEHEVHHRGELSLILGTLGRKGLDV
jgi:uncharacterized damage-inducible protein DinB